MKLTIFLYYNITQLQFTNYCEGQDFFNVISQFDLSGA